MTTRKAFPLALHTVHPARFIQNQPRDTGSVRASSPDT